MLTAPHGFVSTLFYIPMPIQCLRKASLAPNIRRLAFDKVAALSTSVPFNHSQSQDIDRLSKACARQKSQANGFLDGVFKGLAPTSREPMVISQLSEYRPSHSANDCCRAYGNSKFSLPYAKLRLRYPMPYMPRNWSISLPHTFLKLHHSCSILPHSFTKYPLRHGRL
jgi:hypothetical protein